jgi:hypothetical protein
MINHNKRWLAATGMGGYNHLPPSNSEIEDVIEEFNEKLGSAADDALNDLAPMLENSIPISEAKELVLTDYVGAFESDESYTRIESWDEEIPPPKVADEDWIHLDEDTCWTELAQFAETRLGASGQMNVVYCLECELLAESLLELQRSARDLFGELPLWVNNAWTAETVLYVGQSGDLKSRLRTHAVGNMSDSPPPGRLPRLSRPTSVGIVSRHSSREDSERFEERYATNLSSITPDTVYISSS